MAKHPSQIDIRRGLTKATLVYGLFLLTLFGVAIAGFGVGVPEILVWLALVAAWVTFWMTKRRR
jgi:ABC-type uncharacterized transport system fused permease/ATPase subunit